MTAATLKNYTAKDLAQMAKKRGVPGWHAMRKEQLIHALTERPNGRPSSGTRRRNAGKATSRGSRPTDSRAVGKAPPSKGRTEPRIRKQISLLHAQSEQAKNLGQPESGEGDDKSVRDRIVVMVRDPYWLQAHWELAQSTIARVRAAMGQHWHLAKPVLRLFEVLRTGTATPSDALLRTIEIHGGVNTWYIDVKSPESTYRLEIGYLGDDGQFHPLARSNTVTPPAAALREATDRNWEDVAENLDKIYALSGGYSPEGTSAELRELLEERLQRPMGTSMGARFGAGACNILQRKSGFHFKADAEMIIYGSTNPGSHVSLKGEPVSLRDDGSFTVKLDMPNKRQVIPIVATSSDGIEKHTIVLAVERNTKQMETIIRDATI